MGFTIEIGADNPILRTVCEEIKPHELAEYGKLGEKMVKYIKNPKSGGIGIAAPQIGITKRVACVGLPDKRDDDHYQIIYMINPTIVESSEETEIGNEGCLSLPDEYGYVKRAKEVIVEYLDGKGKKYRRKVSGFGSKVVQHEIDHLNGVLFIDKLEEPPKEEE